MGLVETAGGAAGGRSHGVPEFLILQQAQRVCAQFLQCLP